jgi:hypothetical protein
VPTPAISSRRRSPRELPTLAAFGEPSPVHATRSPEEKKKGERRKGSSEADHEYVGAAAKTWRPLVGLQDAEELWTMTHQHLYFFYQRRRLPLRHVEPFSTAAFTFWPLRP